MFPATHNKLLVAISIMSYTFSGTPFLLIDIDATISKGANNLSLFKDQNVYTNHFNEKRLGFHENYFTSE